MQISASALLAQQAARVAPKAAQPTDAFAPLNFKQAAKTSSLVSQTQAAAPGPSAALSAGPSASYVRPGTNIDIKV